MQPRDYQTKFIESVEAGWKDYRKQLGVAPTGAGKTIIFSWLAKRRLDSTGQKTLILAHRDELIDQAIKKLHAATGIIADKEKAEFRARQSAPVVVASVQTMMGRLDRWDPNHFGLGIADEAHHSLSPSWRKALDHFKFDLLGVTATPDRGDKRDLGELYENIAYEISLKELIRDGHLCPIAIHSLPLRIDLSSVDSTRGDLDSTQLGHALEPYLDQIAFHIAKEVGHRKVLAFLPLISTSNKFVDSCRRAGLTAKHIDGDSPDRAEILESFAAGGEFQILSNAMLLTEGYDCPSIDCVIVLRPTRIRSLFSQMVGRGTRTHPGKKNLLILDFLWLHKKHDICRPACLVAGSQEEADMMMEIIDKKTAIPGDVAANIVVDLMDALSETAVKREDALRKKLEALSKRRATFISAEEFALNAGDLETAEYFGTMGWHNQPPTDKQIEYLNRANIDTSTVKGTDHASRLIALFFQQQNARPADRRVKFMMSKVGWRSKDNQRGPWQATMQDQRQFWAEQPKKKKTPKKQPQTTFWE